MAKMNRHASKIRSWIILAVIFIGAFAGLFGGNDSLESASYVTRIDVLHEWGRVLRTLRPLLRNEALSSFRMPPYSDLPAEEDEMSVVVLGAGLMQGFSDGRFLPEQQMSRGEGALAAGRLEEFIRSCLRSMPKMRERRPDYSDVLEGHWLFDSLKRLGGIGALSTFGGEQFFPDQILSGAELRSIGNDIIEYFGQDVAILESTPEGLAVSLKAAIGELSPRDIRYCWAGGVWRMMPESGVIPWEERKSGGRLHITAAEWTVTPTDVVPLKRHVWYAAVRRNTAEVIKELRGAGKNTESVPTLYLNGADEHTKKRLEAHLNALYARLDRFATPTEEAPSMPLSDDFVSAAPVHTPIPAPKPTAITSPTPVSAPKHAPMAATFPAPAPVTASAPSPTTVSSTVKQSDGAQGRTAVCGKREQAALAPVAVRQSPFPDAVRTFSERGKERPANNVPVADKDVIQVTGRLLDSLTRRPIDGATVLLGSKDFTTRKDGTFRFQVRKDSLIEVTAYAEGYEALALKYRAGFRNAPLVLQLRPVYVSFVGTVTNLETGEPISGACVKLGGQSVVTNSIGEFRLSKVAATFHQMSCSAPGYMEACEIAYVDADGKPYNIQMRPLVSSGTSSGIADDLMVPDE